LNFKSLLIKLGQNKSGKQNSVTLH